MTGDTADKIERYADQNPGVSPAGICGALQIDPTEHYDTVAEIIGQKEHESTDVTPTPDVETNGSKNDLNQQSPDEDTDLLVNNSALLVTWLSLDVPIPDGVELIERDSHILARQEADPETGHRTDVGEFRRFHELLIAEAPDGYTPHYIAVERDGKAPAGGATWSADDDRLTFEQAQTYLKYGANIGIAGLSDDPLVDLDIDDPDLVDAGDVKPTLRAVSRSRPTDPGGHGWYFGGGDLPNIDSDAGEVRTDNQYVLAPGSHVPIDLSDPDDPDLADIPADDRNNVGRYSIAEERPAAGLEYEDLPEVYRTAHEERKAVVESRPDTRETPPEPSPAVDSENRSAVFDLDIPDVTGLSWGYRGVNPIGHHSNDNPGNDGYFVLLKDRGVAHDHKDGVSFSAASFALADVGERNPRTPNGGMSDREYFVFWKYAKDRNLIPSDDPIPSRGLKYIALNAGLCDAGDIEDGWKLPPKAHNDALDIVRKKHGLDPGRDPIPTGDDVEKRAVLPNTPVDRAGRFGSLVVDDRDATNDGLTVDDVRGQTVDAIAKALKGGWNLVEVLPTGGKTYGSVEAASRSDTPPVSIFTTRGRKEQYEQIESWCEDAGLDAKILPSFFETCPTAAGEHGDELADLIRDWYRRGATGQAIHKFAEDALGRPLPCQHEHGEAVECPYTSAWRFDTDDYDVLIGHYNHSHNPKVVSGRAAVFDEHPGDTFERTLGANLDRAVSAFLDDRDDIPYADYTDLLEARHDDVRRAESIQALAEDGIGRDTRSVLEDDDAHADAPLAAFTLLAAVDQQGDLGNGWERATFPDGSRIGLYNREDGEVRVLAPPDLDTARSVAALDGTPTKEMWELALGGRLHHTDVLGDDETRAEYVRDALNINVIRTTDAVKSYSCGADVIDDRVSVAEDTALLEAIADKHGEKPGVITTKRAKDHVYKPHGTLEYAETVKHYGNVLGSNELAEKRVGAILGSRNFGPDYVQRWTAYLGDATEPTFPAPENDFTPTDYGSVGNRIRTHYREHETLQALLRFGRDGNGATVYVHTDTLPNWVPITDEGRVITTRSDGERQVLDAVKGRTEWTTADVADAVDISDRQVRSILENFVERGHLTREADPNDGRRTLWVDDGTDDLSEHGDVDLGDDDEYGGDGDTDFAETSPIGTIYRWNFRNFSDLTTTLPANQHDSRVATDGGRPNGGDTLTDDPVEPGEVPDHKSLTGRCEL